MIESFRDGNPADSPGDGSLKIRRMTHRERQSELGESADKATALAGQAEGGDLTMTKKETAKTWAGWSYELHSLERDAEDWASVKAGERITIDGDDYGYEGVEFSDTWRFKRGVGGDLRVTYGGEEEGPEGEGFTGHSRRT